MPDYWLDADSLITPYRGAYRFSIVPQFWDFIKQKAVEGIIASPEPILEDELTNSDPKKRDELEEWARGLKGILFLPVDTPCQQCYRDVVRFVQGNGAYRAQHIDEFLRGADPWLVAFAMSDGGRIVTFEVPQPQAKKPKVPDVAEHFGIKCLTLWDMLAELKWKS